MGKDRKWFMLPAAVVSLSLVATACGGDDGGETGSNGATALEGTITISGSSTVQPITSLVAELFNEDVSDDVAISVDGPGTSDGFVLFCDGETDIQDASRAIEQEEIDACSANGVEYVELAVAFDGITVMTNPANGDVSCIDNGDIYGLFGPQSNGIDTWAGANDLAQQVGGDGGLPDVPLEITAPGEESGTYDAFIDLSGIEDLAIENGVPEDEAASLRTDYQSSPDDNAIIAAMEGSETPLGFVGYAFAEGAGEGVKLIDVDGGDGCVTPSRGTIADGSYPLSRTLYIYVNTGNVAQNPALGAFVDYYMTETGLVEAVPAVGYVELPADQLSASQAAWAAV
ncbi:MAG: substrate-binding domain-containing protein [Actinobacteria bacterium]|nr:substrate-binding domain-containing protein [Actinomycetota bacterium]